MGQFGAGGDATRVRIIDAAATCFYRYGVPKTTIDDVANEVQMSRRTVYRYFANKNELFAAVIDRELQEMSREGRQIYETSPFGEGLIEVALVMTRRVAESPTLSRMFSTDASGTTMELLFGGREFTVLVEKFLSPFIRRAQNRGEMRKDIKTADAVEWITHLMFSLLAPNPIIASHDDDHVRFLLRTFVLPGLSPNAAVPAEPAAAESENGAGGAKRPRAASARRRSSAAATGG
ncbi:hypothetical protein BJF78_00710 [Pseudonocardia sp. CNS-139]|nr:hypothetical protein BJF78_00710 [Pseudonocardia sp. CNS-139]